MKTNKINTEKNQNPKSELGFEILTKFEMKKIIGGDGDDDDNTDPVEWTT